MKVFLHQNILLHIKCINQSYIFRLLQHIWMNLLIIIKYFLFVCFSTSLMIVSTEDPEEQKCYFLYYYIKEIYNIEKVFRVFRKHQGHTHTQTKTRLKTSLRRSPDFAIQSSGSSGTFNFFSFKAFRVLQGGSRNGHTDSMLELR